MNIEEGTELICCTNDYFSVIKGERVIVDKIIRNKMKLKGKSKYSMFSIKDFKVAEPVNKFEVGDEVLFDGSEKCKIIFIAGEKDRMGNEYAVDFENKKDHYYEFVSEKALSPLKNKDELEAGDKFKSGCDKYVILFKEYDVARSEIKYLLKDLNTGELLLRGTGDIDEIIYD